MTEVKVTECALAGVPGKPGSVVLLVSEVPATEPFPNEAAGQAFHAHLEARRRAAREPALHPYYLLA